jgi:hypothetical protein
MINFTVPEINFLCIFADKDKDSTIYNIMSAIPDFTDNELVALAEEIVVKLDKMRDSDFSDWDFASEFTDGFDDENR